MIKLSTNDTCLIGCGVSGTKKIKFQPTLFVNNLFKFEI